MKHILIQHFHVVVLFELTFTFTWCRSILTRYLLHPLGHFLAKLGFAASISPVSTAYGVESDDFELGTDLELAFDLKKIFP